MENALIIFVRNSEKGKIKTRLSKDLGEDKTLEVYKYLLQYTRDVCFPCNCNHFVFYSSYVHLNDAFDDDTFTKFIQEGDELGERMINALTKVFALGCKKVCVIGSDCYQLQTDILQDAFNALDENDVVIGPALDGGYYLLGMKQLHAELFLQKQWGTSTVLDDTLQVISKSSLSVAELKVLNDIDTIEDLLETNILTHLEEDDLPINQA